jgi:predicted nucleic acid-binding protein
MKQVILDTNVIIALLTNEEETEKALALYQYLVSQDYQILIPEYLPVEFYSVVRRKEQLKQISPEVAREVLRTFRDLNLKIVPVDQSILNVAYTIATDMKQNTIYDTLFLAVAQRYTSFLISADNKFISAARTLYPSVCTLRSWEKCFVTSS